jgi:acetyltransferase-like isoleucine patch superfamily enzyme
MIHARLAQHMIEDDAGRSFIENDWFPKPLPDNIILEEMSYPDTSYSFSTFFSEKEVGFKMGFASGNYGHGIFTTGKKGEIQIGNFVVLQCTRLICNLRIDIKDHCMFSWGSTITDSWVTDEFLSVEYRKHLLEAASERANRHVEFDVPKPVFIDENVWVGFEAVILPGVNIGRGAIVGSKSVIFEDVPPYAVVVGNPGKIIRYLEPTDLHFQKEKMIHQYLNEAK